MADTKSAAVADVKPASPDSLWERFKKRLEFFQEVRSEARRVVWPNRKETGLTTLMVFIMAAVAMLFLFLVDQILRFGIEGVVSLGGG